MSRCTLDRDASRGPSCASAMTPRPDRCAPPSHAAANCYATALRPCLQKTWWRPAVARVSVSACDGTAILRHSSEWHATRNAEDLPVDVARLVAREEDERGRELLRLRGTF